MKVTTHHGEMHQSRGDYGEAIKHYRRPSHWPATLWLLAIVWIFVGLFLLAGCSEVADAQASYDSHQDAIAMAQAAGIPPANK
jgi:hypothetical protein